MTVHYCPPVGRTADGDEFDCGACRAELLHAFRPAPEARPHLCLPVQSAVTVPLTEEVAVLHELDSGVERFQEEPGGYWWVRCSCGWTREGRYARPTGEPVAHRLVRHWFSFHVEHPEEG